MSTPNVSSMQETAKALLQEAQEKPAPKELRSLAERIDKLRAEVMDLEGNVPLKQQVARLMVLKGTALRGSLGEIPPGALLTQLGVINQYDDRAGKGPNSSCTSCAQCFLARIMPKGTIRSLHSTEIDSIVEDGWKNFELLLKNKEKLAKSAGVSIAQAMDCNECSMIYGLDMLKEKDRAAPPRILVKDAEGSTEPFFLELLEMLEKRMEGRQTLVGIIHSQGKTYALALFRVEGGFEYALFDSHGDSTLNGGRSAAYVKYTDTQAVMAEFLAKLIQYKSFDDPEFSKEERRKIEQSEEENGFILYTLEHKDHVLLGEPSPTLPPGTPPFVGEVPPLEKPIEKLKPLEGSSSSKEDTVNRQNIAAFLCVLAAMGIFYKVYVNRQIRHQVKQLSKA